MVGLVFHQVQQGKAEFGRDVAKKFLKELAPDKIKVSKPFSI